MSKLIVTLNDGKVGMKAHRISRQLARPVAIGQNFEDNSPQESRTYRHDNEEPPRRRLYLPGPRRRRPRPAMPTAAIVAPATDSGIDAFETGLDS